jgi:hypothetical protein
MSIVPNEIKRSKKQRIAVAILTVVVWAIVVYGVLRAVLE